MKDTFLFFKISVHLNLVYWEVVFMLKFFKSLFSSNKGSISSKRVFGGLGFLVCISIAIVSVVMDKTVSAFCSELLYTCAALLGIDSVANAFYKDGKKKNDQYKYEDKDENTEDY